MQCSYILKIGIPSNSIVPEVPDTTTFMALRFDCVQLIWIKVLWISGRNFTNVETSLSGLWFSADVGWGHYKSLYWCNHYHRRFCGICHVQCGDPPGLNQLWPCLPRRRAETVCSLDGGGSEHSSRDIQVLHTIWPKMTPNPLTMSMTRYSKVNDKARCSSLTVVYRNPYHERFPFLATCDDHKALCLNGNTCFLYMFLNVPATYKSMQVTSRKAQLIS